MDKVIEILGLGADADGVDVQVAVAELLRVCEAVCAARVKAERELGVLRGESWGVMEYRMREAGYGEESLMAARCVWEKAPRVLCAAVGVEVIGAANPYGCNQYGEGWAEEHDGNSTEWLGNKKLLTRRDEKGNLRQKMTDKKHPGKGAYEGVGVAKKDGEPKIEPKTEPKTEPKKEGKDENPKDPEKKKAEPKKRYFEPATTMKAAKANTASLVGGDLKKVTWGKYMKLEQVNEYNEVMAEMFEKYPLNVEVNKLGSYTKSKIGEGAHVSYGWQPKLDGININIQINQDHYFGGVHYLPDWRPYDEKQTASSGYMRHNVGVTDKGMSIRTIMIHEYGHALHANAYVYSDYGYVLKNVDDKEKKGYADDWMQWTNAYNKAISSKDVRKISEYAAKNEREFFAECFTARELGEKLPDYIESALDKIVKRATKKV